MPQSPKASFPAYSDCVRHVGQAIVTRICPNNRGAFIEGKVIATECEKSYNKIVLIHFSKIYDHSWMYEVVDIGDIISIDFPLKKGKDLLAYTAADNFQEDDLLAKAPQPQPEPEFQSPSVKTVSTGTSPRKAQTFAVKRTFRHEEAKALSSAKELLCMQNHEVLEHCVRYAISSGYVDHVKTLVETE